MGNLLSWSSQQTRQSDLQLQVAPANLANKEGSSEFWFKGMWRATYFPILEFIILSQHIVINGNLYNQHRASSILITLFP